MAEDFFTPMDIGRVLRPSSESMSSMSLAISLPMDTRHAIAATTALAMMSPTSALPSRKTIPVSTAMVRFPTNPLCLRNIS